MARVRLWVSEELLWPSVVDWFWGRRELRWWLRSFFLLRDSFEGFLGFMTIIHGVMRLFAMKGTVVKPWTKVLILRARAVASPSSSRITSSLVVLILWWVGVLVVGVDLF